MVNVTINGKVTELVGCGTVLEALRTAGVEVPTLCHDPRLKPAGVCRLCIVQIDGEQRPVTACSTQVEDGMRIQTHTPEIEHFRRHMLQMLLQDYPAEMIRRFPEKEFHRYVRAYEQEQHAKSTSDPELKDDSHPYIHVDMSQCVYCFRCVRICEELQGQFVWKIHNRGDSTRIVPDSGTTLLASSCVSCGACVDTCPSGALEDKTLLHHGVPTRWGKTTCPYCGTGCEMNVGTRGNEIVTIQPVLEAPVSKGHLCVKGRYAFAFQNAPDRVTQPMIRESGEWKEVSWPEAIGTVAEKLREIIERHGPDSVGMLGSARATNEENYAAQKFARAVIGTNNVDCCARVCHAPTAEGMKQILGTGAATNSFDDIELAQTIMVCGANATENHPIVSARIKQAALCGIPLIVIDPRKIELTQYAAVHLALRPGTNVPLFNAMANVLVEENLIDADFVRERVAATNEFWEFIRAWTPERAAEICGVDAELIRSAARLYATKKPAMCFHGLGLTEHLQGTESVMALVNLALLTGSIGIPGAGINPLRGQNNVQGAAHMGCDPKNLTGFLPLEKGREAFEKVWQAKIPTRPGLNLMQMMDAAAAGHLKSLWAIGYDVLLTNPHRAETQKAFEKIDFVIIQDLFLNETAREFGHVFLPAASPFEKDGTFMNAERRIQRVRKILEPAQGCKTDWEILCDVARAMGKAELFAYGAAEEIWNEVRQVWPKGKGISYERIEQEGLQWPCESEESSGTQRLHVDGFTIGPRASLQRIDYTPTPETINEEFPFVLVTGRTLYQFNAGTMTQRTPNAELYSADYLDISLEDASRLSLADREMILLRSRYGQARLPARISATVKPGLLFATFHTVKAAVNFVTGRMRDRHVQTPEYKVTAVRIEKMR